MAACVVVETGDTLSIEWRIPTRPAKGTLSLSLFASRDNLPLTRIVQPLSGVQCVFERSMKLSVLPGVSRALIEVCSRGSREAP